jgi:hypothetical protein
MSLPSLWIEALLMEALLEMEASLYLGQSPKGQQTTQAINIYIVNVMVQSNNILIILNLQ